MVALSVDANFGHRLIPQRLDELVIAWFVLTMTLYDM